MAAREVERTVKVAVVLQYAPKIWTEEYLADIAVDEARIAAERADLWASNAALAAAQRELKRGRKWPHGR